MISIKRVNDLGFEILKQLAKSHAHLFIEADSSRLQNKIQDISSGKECFEEEPIKLACSLEKLNSLRFKGPDSDAEFSPVIYDALSPVSFNDIADPNYWASLNCFALDRYTTVRWSYSGSNLVEKDPPRFVLKHWLENDREGNAAMRLWWLREISKRTARFTSRYSADSMLEAMAGHVSLYHQLLDRSNLLPNWRLSAIIWEHALDGNNHLFQTKNANALLKTLNLLAATRSLDLMGDEDLRELVREATPVPKV